MDDAPLALAMADAADAVTLPRFARGAAGAVRRKADRSPVTEADALAEQALRDLLHRHRPQDAVLGEELGATGGAAGRRWLLDPVDGTMSFARGIPVWGTLVALEERGSPVLGLVSAPALGRRWWAARGPDGAPGAWACETGQAPRRTGVSDTRDLRDALLGCANVGGLGDPQRRAAVVALGERAQWMAGYESFWGPALVAEGALDAAILPEGEEWDLAPLRALVEAAGGRCTALDFGAATGRRGALFSNAALHAELLGALSA